MAAKTSEPVASDEKNLEHSLSETSNSQQSQVDQQEAHPKSSHDIEGDPSVLTEADKEAAAEPSSDPNVVTWDGPDDPNRPHNWTKKSK